MEKSKVDEAVKGCLEAGINNILALRGDPPAGETVWHAQDAGLTCGLDLVNYIRTHFEEAAQSLGKVNITVAGYPEGHPAAMSEVDDFESLSETEKGRASVTVNEDGKKTVMVCKDADYTKEMAYLKQKIDAGANMIITQMFFDYQVFNTFVKDCRAIGINVPILPGIMCIGSFAGFKRMTGFCKTKVPQAIYDMLAKANEALDETEEAIKAAAAEVKKVGLKIVEDMCRELLKANCPGLHFYTLNQSGATLEICANLRKDKLIR
jgi:methylenetetrahydrofolate reductase (NADPH)